MKRTKENEIRIENILKIDKVLCYASHSN